MGGGGTKPIDQTSTFGLQGFQTPQLVGLEIIMHCMIAGQTSRDAGHALESTLCMHTSILVDSHSYLILYVYVP